MQRTRKTEGKTRGLTKVHEKTPKNKTTQEKTTQKNTTQEKTT